MTNTAGWKRVERGIVLFHAGAAKVIGADDGTVTVLVRAQSREKPYTVLLGPNGATCTCPDFQKSASTWKWAQKKGTLDKVSIPLLCGQPVCKHIQCARMYRSLT